MISPQLPLTIHIDDARGLGCGRLSLLSAPPCSSCFERFFLLVYPTKTPKEYAAPTRREQSGGVWIAQALLSNLCSSVCTRAPGHATESTVALVLSVASDSAGVGESVLDTRGSSVVGARVFSVGVVTVTAISSVLTTASGSDDLASVSVAALTASSAATNVSADGVFKGLLSSSLSKSGHLSLVWSASITTEEREATDSQRQQLRGVLTLILQQDLREQKTYIGDRIVRQCEKYRRKMRVEKRLTA